MKELKKLFGVLMGSTAKTKVFFTSQANASSNSKKELHGKKVEKAENLLFEKDESSVKMTEVRHPDGRMSRYPPVERWDHWNEWESSKWPKKIPKSYSLVPTICFNCESACGLLAYVDKKNYQIKKFEGNPVHPGSRGRNCAKGPATLNQINDPERILYPLKRVGADA